MSRGSERLRAVLARPGCTSVAPIFDPLSARIAEMIGCEVVKLSGSVGKFANLAVPDGVPMTNMSDLVDVVRRVTRMADVTLTVDADDGGSALGMLRAMRELEAAGVSGIELEDNSVPSHFSDLRHGAMLSKEDQVNKLKAAVAAKRDPSTVVFGRSSALSMLPLDEALDRIAAYAKTGVDAIMLPGQGKRGLSPNPRSDIEQVQKVANLPLCISGLSADLLADEKWMNANRVKLRFNGQAPYRMAVKAIYDALKHINSGGAATDFKDRWAPDAMLEELTHTAELRAWEAKYDPAEKKQ
ncbi:MAG TPA: isocitrate lyase/phosphoenolpyruvate mutase family protein [Bauldia sp.]|nr:isocitrate lyase/phosphoenolpyruvate mutase family protein [Bauldia sp.]